ncbi:hypothetical protein FD723_39785 (plasmid) [Nostoc sp. C052]|uniref:hypothetical protein n=1 Tax=Nostoc sp. C052 TaxID=2576902 RepID=UPI0015C32A0C|nr:hypothetical protein [Nostoc sp. C052]QLE46354.1 hypothetical protein FD723_39785 [Nostoc sp. C052]
MNSCYEVMKLNHDEAEALVGKIIDLRGDAMVVHLDEMSAILLGTQYDAIVVWKRIYRGKSLLNVSLPGIEDFYFQAWFYPSQDLYLSVLIEKIYVWAKRYNYRHLNVHALEDYCKYLGATDFSWS